MSRAASHRAYGARRAVLLLLLTGSEVQAEGEIQVDALPVRDFGYTIGDRIKREFQVTLPPGRALEQEFLPSPGPIDEWLELTGADWQPTPNANSYRLRVEYQVFKGVRSPETIQVPPLKLHWRGATAGEGATPAWAFTLQPLIPTGTPDSDVVLRPPAAPVPPDAAKHWRRVAFYAAGIAVLLAIRSWIGWLNLRAKRPFALALRDIKALPRRQPDSSFDPRPAIRHIHRALDATAGHRLFAKQLDAFLTKHKPYSALRADLTRFFELSERLFFTASEPGLADDTYADWVETLCRRCAEIEAGNT